MVWKRPYVWWMGQFCYCLGHKGKSVWPPQASEVLASCSPLIIPRLWRSAPLHTHAPCQPDPLDDPNHQNNAASPAAEHIDCTDEWVQIWALEDFQLHDAGFVIQICAGARRMCQCLHSGPEKSTDPNLDWSHLCHCIVLSEQSVRRTKQHILPLLPLPPAFFPGSEWNTAQLFAHCLGGKSETDFFIVIVIPNNGESVS